MVQRLGRKLSGVKRDDSAECNDAAIARDPQATISAQDSSTHAFPTLAAAHGGEWIDAGQLHQWAMEQLGLPVKGATADGRRADRSAGDLAVDVAGLEFLEAGALQVLLALRSEQAHRGHRLHLLNPSQSLREWFEFAGAADLLDTNPVSAAKEV
jgi:ABC-type transporter Mla MlaB component